VPKIVAHGLWELTRRPEQLSAVRADLDANVRVARDEMIRYCAPAQWFARTLRKPYPSTERRSTRASASSPCWPRPTVMSASIPTPMSSSGTGALTALWPSAAPALCLGFHLARLEIAVLVQEWLKRVPAYHVDAEAAPGRVEFPVGLEQHPVEVDRVVLPACRAIHVREKRICRTSPLSVSAKSQLLLRFLGAGSCGSDIPGFRGTQGRLPGDTGASVAGMDGFPIHEIVGEVLASRIPA